MDTVVATVDIRCPMCGDVVAKEPGEVGYDAGDVVDTWELIKLCPDCGPEGV